MSREAPGSGIPVMSDDGANAACEQPGEQPSEARRPDRGLPSGEPARMQECGAWTRLQQAIWHSGSVESAARSRDTGADPKRRRSAQATARRSTSGNRSSPHTLPIYFAAEADRLLSSGEHSNSFSSTSLRATMGKLIFHGFVNVLGSSIVASKRM